MSFLDFSRPKFLYKPDNRGGNTEKINTPREAPIRPQERIRANDNAAKSLRVAVSPPLTRPKPIIPRPETPVVPPKPAIPHSKVSEKVKIDGAGNPIQSETPPKTEVPKIPTPETPVIPPKPAIPHSKVSEKVKIDGAGNRVPNGDPRETTPPKPAIPRPEVPTVPPKVKIDGAGNRVPNGSPPETTPEKPAIPRPEAQEKINKITPASGEADKRNFDIKVNNKPPEVPAVSPNEVPKIDRAGNRVPNGDPLPETTQPEQANHSSSPETRSETNSEPAKNTDTDTEKSLLNRERKFTPEEQKAGKFTSPDAQGWDIPPGSTEGCWERTANGGSKVSWGANRKEEPVKPEPVKPEPVKPEPVKPETEAYKKKEAEFQKGLQNGSMTQLNAQGEREFNESGRKAFRDLTLTEHEYIPGAIFSQATHGEDAMPTDAAKREQALKAQEKEFFKNHEKHAELAQTPSEVVPARAERTGSQAKKHLVNGGEDHITFETGKGIVSGNDSDLSIARWRNYDYDHRKSGYPKLTVFSEEKDAAGRPQFSGTVVHPRDPKAKEIQETLARGGQYPNLYTTHMDIYGNGKLEKVFILPPSMRANGYAVSQSLGDAPKGPSKVAVLREKKVKIEPTILP